MGQMGQQMDHSEAQEQMAVERYLLDELSPEEREAFEAHFFDCPECAFDLRAATAFVDEAKVQLPGFTSPSLAASAERKASPEPSSRAESGSANGSRKPSRSLWSSLVSWVRPVFASPAFAGPVFAALLIVIGYQNLVTYPALQTAANEPRLVPSVFLRAGTRGGTVPVVDADRKLGASVLVDASDLPTYASYVFDLYDPQGKLAWTQNIAAVAAVAGDGALSLSIPGASLREGKYALAISGVDAAGQRTEIRRQDFAVHIHD